MNSRRMIQDDEIEVVVNAGVAVAGIVGVKMMRLEKRVDSECDTYTFRVARRMEEAERRATLGVMVSENSSDALI